MARINDARIDSAVSKVGPIIASDPEGTRLRQARAIVDLVLQDIDEEIGKEIRMLGAADQGKEEGYVHP